MVFGKYKGDYRIGVENNNGKLVDKTVYIGKLYYLKNSDKRKNKSIMCLVFSIIMMLCIFGALYPNCMLTRRAYFVIALEVTLIPLFFQAMASYTLLTLKEPMTRETKDKSIVRIHNMTRTVMLFLLISLVGDIVATIKYFDLFSFNDIIISVVVVLEIAVQFYLIRTEEKFEVVEEANPAAEEFAKIDAEAKAAKDGL